MQNKAIFHDWYQKFNSLCQSPWGFIENQVILDRLKLIHAKIVIIDYFPYIGTNIYQSKQK